MNSSWCWKWWNMIIHASNYLHTNWKSAWNYHVNEDLVAKLVINTYIPQLVVQLEYLTRSSATARSGDKIHKFHKGRLQVKYNRLAKQKRHRWLSICWRSHILTEFSVWDTQNITCTRAWLTIYLTASGPTEQTIPCCYI